MVVGQDLSSNGVRPLQVCIDACQWSQPGRKLDGPDEMIMRERVGRGPAPATKLPISRRCSWACWARSGR